MQSHRLEVVIADWPYLQSAVLDTIANLSTRKNPDIGTFRIQSSLNRSK